MIRLKLVKGAVDNQRMETEDPGGLHGTRVIKELVAPWEHSGRVVAADSYFASVPYVLLLCMKWDYGLLAWLRQQQRSSL